MDAIPKNLGFGLVMARCEVISCVGLECVKPSEVKPVGTEEMMSLLEAEGLLIFSGGSSTVECILSR